MRVLWLGHGKAGATGLHQVSAMRRRGHDVRVISTTELLRHSYVRDRIHHRSGYRLAAPVAARALGALLGDETYDVAWVGGGREIGPQAVRRLREVATRVVAFNNDDPWGARDGRLWSTFKAAVPEYDAVVVARPENVAEAFAGGARRVIRAWRSFDEVVHLEGPTAPPAYDVVFVGSWEGQRGALMRALANAGLSVGIWGPAWNKSPEWPELRSLWHGSYLADEEYTRTLSKGRIALGLLSHANRDQHTRRSVEVPAIGVPLLAERTPEHERLLGDSARLWTTHAECISSCHDMLRSKEDLEAVTHGAKGRIVDTFSMGNEQMTEAVLDFARGETRSSTWPPSLADRDTADETGASGA